MIVFITNLFRWDETILHQQLMMRGMIDMTADTVKNAFKWYEYTHITLLVA